MVGMYSLMLEVDKSYIGLMSFCCVNTKRVRDRLIGALLGTGHLTKCGDTRN